MQENNEVHSSPLAPRRRRERQASKRSFSFEEGSSYEDPNPSMSIITVQKENKPAGDKSLNCDEMWDMGDTSQLPSPSSSTVTSPYIPSNDRLSSELPTDQKDKRKLFGVSQDDSQVEDFLVEVLLTIKSSSMEEHKNHAEKSGLKAARLSSAIDPISGKKKAVKYEFVSHTCEEHKKKHLRCPFNCRGRIIEKVEKVVYLDDDESSNMEEKELRISSSFEHELDTTSSNGYSSTSSRKRNRSDSVAEESFGMKLASIQEDDDEYSPDVPKRRSNGNQTKKISSKSTRNDLNDLDFKPTNDVEACNVIRWALGKLPNQQGNIGEVFGLLEEKGSKGMVESDKKIIERCLIRYFVTQQKDDLGNQIFSSNDLLPSDQKKKSPEEPESYDNETTLLMLQEYEAALQKRKSTKTGACTIHVQAGKRCPIECPNRDNNLEAIQEREKSNEEKERNRKQRQERARSRRGGRYGMDYFDSSISDMLYSDHWLSDERTFQEQNEKIVNGKKRRKVSSSDYDLSSSSSVDDFNSLDGDTVGSNAGANGDSKGRRWIRFACERHRREHAKCPDNCPNRTRPEFVFPNGEDSMDMTIKNQVQAAMASVSST